MKEPSNDALEELLMRAVTNLRGASPEDPPRELINSTMDRIRNAQCGPGTVRVDKSRWRRIASYGAVAVVVASIAVLAGWLILLDRTAAPAFAEVIQQVANVVSVTFFSDSTTRDDATNEIVNRERVQWYVQGQRIRLEEIDGSVAIIADLDRRQIYRLDLKQKTATAEPLIDEIAEMIVNPLAQVQKIDSNDAKLVGPELLDGRKVLLYQMDRIAFLMMEDRGSTKIWVDPGTRLPLRIVVEPMQRKRRNSSTELTNFEWNKNLAASLFRVPQGYTMVDATRWMRDRQKGKPERTERGNR
jgi:outer membrane lipoprotein-sorting protein